jgi:hypothetical protein
MFPLKYHAAVQPAYVPYRPISTGLVLLPIKAIDDDEATRLPSMKICPVVPFSTATMWCHMFALGAGVVRSVAPVPLQLVPPVRQ